MPITIDKKNGMTILTIRGEVDHHSARTIMQNIDQIISSTLPMQLTLDLSGITFMDSSGIAVLLRTLRQMDQLGGTLRVVSIPPQPRRVLDAAGLGRLITLE